MPPPHAAAVYLNSIPSGVRGTSAKTAWQRRVLAGSMAKITRRFRWRRISGEPPAIAFLQSHVPVNCSGPIPAKCPRWRGKVGCGLNRCTGARRNRPHAPTSWDTIGRRRFHLNFFRLFFANRFFRSLQEQEMVRVLTSTCWGIYNAQSTPSI